jgi:hypothetical protein
MITVFTDEALEAYALQTGRRIPAGPNGTHPLIADCVHESLVAGEATSGSEAGGGEGDQPGAQGVVGGASIPG